MRNFLTFIIAAGLFLILTVNARAAADEYPEGWSELKTDYFTVQYRPDANLERLYRKINRRRFYAKSKNASLYYPGVKGKLASRLDSLFRRSKDLLGMYPRVEGIKIKIFKDRSGLNSEYYGIFKQKRDLRSFYIYRHNTIYTSENDISDSVIAHEMGHAIVDHYFTVRPPENIRELLSQYVDLHLDD